MAEFIEEIIDDLATEGIISAKGTDGFYDQMPDVSGSVVAVYDNGGTGLHRSPREDVSVGVRVRSALSTVGAYQQARVLAKQVYDRYHQMVDTTLGTTRVEWALCDTLPRSSGRAAGERSIAEFSITFGTDG